MKIRFTLFDEKIMILQYRMLLTSARTVLVKSCIISLPSCVPGCKHIVLKVRLKTGNVKFHSENWFIFY